MSSRVAPPSQKIGTAHRRGQLHCLCRLQAVESRACFTGLHRGSWCAASQLLRHLQKHVVFVCIQCVKDQIRVVLALCNVCKAQETQVTKCVTFSHLRRGPHPGVVDVRGRPDFSRFDPRPARPHFSNFGPPAERRPFCENSPKQPNTRVYLLIFQVYDTRVLPGFEPTLV